MGNTPTIGSSKPEKSRGAVPIALPPGRGELDTEGVLLIADGNNLAWAGFHALRRAMGAESPEEKTRAALLGLTQSVLGFAIRNGEPPAAGRVAPSLQRALSLDGDGQTASRLAVCFDEGRPLRRRQAFAGYQLGRESDPSFRDNEPHVLEAIAQFMDAARSLPVEILRGVNTEADDLVAALVQQAPDDQVRIASTDRDFLQLVDERVSIYSPVKRIVVTSDNFTEHTAPRDSDDHPIAFPRARYLQYRVASGDASDNLPGIPGVGALTAARLLAHAELEAYFEAPSLVSEALGRRNAKLEAALASSEARAAVDRNRALMDLRVAAARYPDLTPYRRRGSWDESGFRAWVARQRIAALDVEAACSTMARLARTGGGR